MNRSEAQALVEKTFLDMRFSEVAGPTYQLLEMIAELTEVVLKVSEGAPVASGITAATSDAEAKMFRHGWNAAIVKVEANLTAQANIFENEHQLGAAIEVVRSTKMRDLEKHNQA